jgi:hypothetical protein
MAQYDGQNLSALAPQQGALQAFSGQLLATLVFRQGAQPLPGASTVDNDADWIWRTGILQPGIRLEIDRVRVDFQGSLTIKLVADDGTVNATPILTLSSESRTQDLRWLAGAGANGVRAAGRQIALQFEGRTTQAGRAGKLFGIKLFGTRHGQ